MENIASENQQQLIEDKAPKNKLGFFTDPQGDKSSGRLVKVSSFFVACVLAGFLIYSLLSFSKDKQADPNVLNSINIAIGGFLTVAVGSEGIQKLTGK